MSDKTISTIFRGKTDEKRKLITQLEIVFNLHRTAGLELILICAPMMNYCYNTETWWLPTAYAVFTNGMHAPFIMKERMYEN